MEGEIVYLHFKLKYVCLKKHAYLFLQTLVKSEKLVHYYTNTHPIVLPVPQMSK
jgi:hypothetical protein